MSGPRTRRVTLTTTWAIEVSIALTDAEYAAIRHPETPIADRDALIDRVMAKGHELGAFPSGDMEWLDTTIADEEEGLIYTNDFAD